MEAEFAVSDARFRKTITIMQGDEGVYPSKAEKLATLKPVVPGGSVTFADQTHPADGAAPLIEVLGSSQSHNPFAVNDIAFGRAFDLDWRRMNNYGSSLIWGHPQGPTGLRGMIEMIEELEIRGGGIGMFQGCAAGDSAMAVVIRVLRSRNQKAPLDEPAG